MVGKCMEKLRLFIWWPSRPTNPTPNQSYTNFHYHRPFHGCQKITFMSRGKKRKSSELYPHCTAIYHGLPNDEPLICKTILMLAVCTLVTFCTSASKSPNQSAGGEASFVRFQSKLQAAVAVPGLLEHLAVTGEKPILSFETRSRIVFFQSRASRRERDFVH